MMDPHQQQEIPAANKYCKAWDRIFHSHKNCPSPTSNLLKSTSTTSPAAQASTPSASSDDDDTSVFIVLAAILVGGAAVVLILSMVLKYKRYARLKAELRRSRGVQQQPQKPSLVSRLSTWWTESRPQERSRPRDVEMGRFKRGLSRVRSIAKQIPEVHISQQRVFQSASIIRTRTTTRASPRQGTPSYAPPAYENTPRGNPIADEFMSAEGRGVEVPVVGTPPPTYQQRTADRYLEGDDGTPAPRYSQFREVGV